MNSEKKSYYSPRKTPPAQINQSLCDGIECLLEITSMERPVGSRELARRLNMDHSRVNRIISTLSYIGVANQTLDKKYVAGSGLLVLASLTLRGSALYHISMPYIEQLCEGNNYRVALGLRWRTNVSYLYHGRPDMQQNLSIGGEGLIPADRSSIGTVLLSQLENEEVEKIYDTNAVGVLSRPQLDELIDRLDIARKDGYAIGANHASTAVPLGEPAIAGIAYSTVDGSPIDANPEELKELVSRLNTVADNIIRDMARR